MMSIFTLIVGQTLRYYSSQVLRTSEKEAHKTTSDFRAAGLACLPLRGAPQEVAFYSSGSRSETQCGLAQQGPGSQAGLKLHKLQHKDQDQRSFSSFHWLDYNRPSIRYGLVYFVPCYFGLRTLSMYRKMQWYMEPRLINIVVDFKKGSKAGHIIASL